MSTPKALATLALTVAIAATQASPFTPGDLLVSQGVFGHDPNTVCEYTPAGQFVQRIAVPSLPGQDTLTDYNRGMVVDAHGRLIVYNGTLVAGVSTYDPATSTWTSTLIPGMTVGSNSNFGKIATFGDYVFLPSQGSGIVRFDTGSKNWTEFASSSSPQSIDLSIGPGGLLYCLNGADVPSGTDLEVYDPLSMKLLRRLDLSQYAWSSQGGSVSEAVVRSDGDIWLNQMYSPTFLVDKGGNLVNNYSFAQTSSVDDFFMGSGGDLAQVDDDGHVYLFDKNFTPTGDFLASDGGGDSFGTFVPSPVPEPAPAAVLAVSLGLHARRTFKRR